MGRSHKRKHRHHNGLGAHEPAQSSHPQRDTARGGDTGDPPAGESWLSTKRPVLRFVLIFGVLVCAFNALFALWIRESDVFGSYLHVNAEICGAILRLFGEQATVSDRLITTPKFSMSFIAGCDALQAAGFFVFAVLASPVKVRLFARLRAVVIGTVLLLLINLIRVITLYYAGAYSRKVFDVMHMDIWQAQIIFLPIFFWLLWIWWARRSQEAKHHVRT